MRKFLLLFAMLLSLSVVYADVYKFQSTSLAYKYLDTDGYWTDWSSWESTSVLIVINLDKDRINIYSKTPQEYDIYDYEDRTYDKDGGETLKFQCVDADGLRCGVRLRVDKDGSPQIYVDYNDMMWVYNVISK